MSAYDRWVLRGPEERHEVGTEPGDECNRYAEPDEDAPRGYRPKPCAGTMQIDVMDDAAVCDTCGEVAS